MYHIRTLLCALILLSGVQAIAMHQAPVNNKQKIDRIQQESNTQLAIQKQLAQQAQQKIKGTSGSSDQDEAASQQYDSTQDKSVSDEAHVVTRQPVLAPWAKWTIGFVGAGIVGIGLGYLLSDNTSMSQQHA